MNNNEYESLHTHLSNELQAIKRNLSDFIPQVLIGTAGTVTTLAALIRNIYPYDPEKIHGTLLTRQEIETLLQDLKIKSLSERLDLKPLEPGREDLIIAGTAIVLKTMKMFKCETLLVSEYSLREGITLKGLENKAYRD